MEFEFSDEALKGIDLILKMHGSIKIPYKKKLLDWYSDMGITLYYLHDSKEYKIYCGHFEVKRNVYKTLREAIDAFEFWMHPKNNVGMALQLILEDHDFDNELDYPPVTKKVRSLLKTKKYNF